MDGRPLAGAALAELRARTAWVDPEVQLWNQPLLENLTYGAPADAAARVAAALDASNLRDVLERLPDGPPAIRLLGEISWRRGDMTEALALVDRAVRAAPGFDLARDFLVRLLIQTNRLPEALEHAEAWAAKSTSQTQREESEMRRSQSPEKGSSKTTERTP